MNKTETISILHIVLLSMTVIGLKNHVTIIPSLLDGAGRDGWISVIIAFFLLIPWLVLLLYISKKLGHTSLRQNLLESYPRFGKWIIYLIVFYLLLMAAFTMRETLQWVNVTFLNKTPILLLFFFFTAVCFMLAMSKILSITMVNVFVLTGVLVLGFLVAFVNIRVKDYMLLLPFFEHGYTPVLKTIVYPGSGFVELLLFIFIQQNVKSQLKFKHFLLMLFLLFGLTLGPLIGAITEFGPIEAAKQRYPAYEEWRIAAIGNFIDHIDFFSIYQWLTGSFVRIGFILYISIDLLGLTGNKKRIWTILVPAFVFCTLPLFLLDDSIFIKLKGQYFLVSTFFILFILAFVLAFIIKRKKNNKAEDYASD